MSNQAYNPIGKDWLTTKQGARLIGVSASYVRKMAISGMVVAIRSGRDWLVSYDSLMAYKAEINRLGNAKHNPWRERPDGHGRGGKA